MRHWKRIVMTILSGALLMGCASMHAADVQKAREADKLTVGTVQREIRVGMSGAQVVEALGSPNVLTTDENGREVWVYDRISTENVYSSSTALILGILTGGSGGGGPGRAELRGKLLDAEVAYGDRQVRRTEEGPRLRLSLIDVLMNMGSSFCIGSAVLAVVLLLAGCAAVTLDKDLNLTPEMLAQRQMQTRRFETTDEQRILKTCAALLQDTGFNIDESDAKLGILTASKARDATDAVQWAMYSAAAILLGVLIPPDADQTMRVLVSTRPVGSDGKQVAVRVVFERTVFNMEHQISKREALNDPKIYQSFFEKLSKALFLEAHDI